MGLNSRVKMTKERIDEFEDRWKESTQSEQKIFKKAENNDHYLRDLCTITKELIFKTSEYQKREESV